MAYPSPRILAVTRDTNLTGGSSNPTPQSPMPNLAPGTTHRLFVFTSDVAINTTMSIAGTSYTWDVNDGSSRASAQKLLSVDKCPNGSTFVCGSIYWSILLYIDLELPPIFDIITNSFSTNGSTYTYQVTPTLASNLAFTCFQIRANTYGPFDSFGGATLLYGSGSEGTTGVQISHTLDPITITSTRSNGGSDAIGATTLLISLPTVTLQAVVDGSAEVDSLLRGVIIPLGVADVSTKSVLRASLNRKKGAVRTVSPDKSVTAVTGTVAHKPYMPMMNTIGVPFTSPGVKILKPNMNPSSGGGGGGGGGGFDGIDGQGWPRGSKGPS